MQTRAAVVVMMAAALLLGGCAGGGGGAFRDRSERDEAARLLLQREADKERALREAQEEAEAARQEKDERAEKALREADEDAERRKREEAEDLQQERRHRRERKEAEHDAELRELYRGSAAPKCYDGLKRLIQPNETMGDWESRCELPQHWRDAFRESDEINRAFIEIGKLLTDATFVFVNPAIHTRSEGLTAAMAIEGLIANYNIERAFESVERAFESASVVFEKMEVSAENLQAAVTEHELDVYHKLEEEAEAKAERIYRLQASKQKGKVQRELAKLDYDPFTTNAELTEQFVELLDEIGKMTVEGYTGLSSWQQGALEFREFPEPKEFANWLARLGERFTRMGTSGRAHNKTMRVIFTPEALRRHKAARADAPR